MEGNLRIGILQLSTKVGDIEYNTKHASELLARIEPDTVSILLMPELALTGYNFTSLEHIRPYLEPTNAGHSFKFAAEQAKRLNCTVVIGYPEIASIPLPKATFPPVEEQLDRPQVAIRSADGEQAEARAYNTVVAVSPSGQATSTYRKHFLYYTDQPWATRGPSFSSGEGTILRKRGTTSTESVKLHYAHGICMDLNPYEFEPHRWGDYEYASNILASPNAPRLILLSNAWNLAAPESIGQTDELLSEWEKSVQGEAGLEPNWPTVEYYCERLRPLITDQNVRYVAISNHCGREGTARYAGSSLVLRLGRGRIQLLGVMGVAEEGVLITEVEI